MSAFKFVLKDLHTGYCATLSYGQNIIVQDPDGAISTQSVKSSEDDANLASIRVELGQAYITITSLRKQLEVRPSSNEPLSEAQAEWYNFRLQTLSEPGNERMMEIRPKDHIRVIGTKHLWTLEVHLLSENDHTPVDQVSAQSLNQAAFSPATSFPLHGLFNATESTELGDRTTTDTQTRTRANEALEVKESQNAETVDGFHQLEATDGEHFLRESNENGSQLFPDVAESRPFRRMSRNEEMNQSPSNVDFDFAEFVTTPSAVQEDEDYQHEDPEIAETQNAWEEHESSTDSHTRSRVQSLAQESVAGEDSQINVIPTPVKVSRKRGPPVDDTDFETTQSTQERPRKNAKANQVKKAGSEKGKAAPKRRAQRVEPDRSKKSGKVSGPISERQTRSKATKEDTANHASFGDENVENDPPEDGTLSKVELPGKKKTAKRSHKPDAAVKSTQTSGIKASPASEHERSKSKKPIRVCFSNTECTADAGMRKFLKSHQVREVGVVGSCDILCIGRGQLRKRPKVLMAVVLGKRIVTDLWLERSKARGCLLDEDDFLASDNDAGSAFGFDPREAVGQGRRELFHDHQVYFSANLRQSLGPDGYREMSKLVSTCGGKVRDRLPPAIDQGSLGFECIVLVQDKKDPRLELEEDGVRCYGRDLVSYSILRGELDLDSKEFLITTD